MGIKWNKPARTATAERSTTPKAKASSIQRPKSIKALRAAKSKSAPSVALPGWLRVGSRAKLIWHYDVAYGSGTASFVGIVTNLDNGWIRAESDDHVICRLPQKIVTVTRVSSR